MTTQKCLKLRKCVVTIAPRLNAKKITRMWIVRNRVIWEQKESLGQRNRSHSSANEPSGGNAGDEFQVTGGVKREPFKLILIYVWLARSEKAFINKGRNLELFCYYITYKTLVMNNKSGQITNAWWDSRRRGKVNFNRNFCGSGSKHTRSSADSSEDAPNRLCIWFVLIFLYLELFHPCVGLRTRDAS